MSKPPKLNINHPDKDAVEKAAADLGKTVAGVGSNLSLKTKVRYNDPEIRKILEEEYGKDHFDPLITVTLTKNGRHIKATYQGGTFQVAKLTEGLDPDKLFNLMFFGKPNAEISPYDFDQVGIKKKINIYETVRKAGFFADPRFRNLFFESCDKNVAKLTPQVKVKKAIWEQLVLNLTGKNTEKVK